TGTRVDDLDELRLQGYSAILVATGTSSSTSLGVPGESLQGVVAGLGFLRTAKQDAVRGQTSSLHGRRVVVVGGGNVAMDAARTARRLGAAEVTVAYRRGRDEMPAHLEEIQAAEQEGVRFACQVTPVEVVGDEQARVRGLCCLRTRLGAPDASGRGRPEPILGSEFQQDCELVIEAVGLKPDVSGLAPAVTTAANDTLWADPGTLQTEVSDVFAAGDVQQGALDIAHAVGQGRRAAFMMDRWMRGQELDPAGFDHLIPVVPAADVLARPRPGGRLEPRGAGARLVPEPRDFTEVEPPLTQDEARYGAQRCLDCGVCSECHQCVDVCEAKAVDLSMKAQEVELRVGAIIVATGFTPFDARRIPEYGYGTYPNVYTSLEVERLLNAAGPTSGELVLRTGERPRSVGIIHCVGSRDARHNTYCSRVCCMASLKLAHLIRERTGAEIYNFYIDMRTPGKGYDEFYGKIRQEGVHFIRGRPVDVSDWSTSPEEEGRLVIRAEDTLAGIPRRIPVDMVVLAVALEPQSDAEQLARVLNISRGSEGFFTERHPKLAPVSTFTDGVFLAGVCSGPKDIPDTVAQAGAAAAEALAMIDRGSVELEPSTAFVDATKCSGCRVCVGLCRFGALTLDPEKNVVLANEVLCKGCGVCVAACPSGALQQHLFTDTQILSEIEGVLQDA
ncbi:MAG TPA: FAD-dependent oxidoreductase, partial [Kineosporiaceae bacterium]|nr:FAD-dependent oxidoreductase [Kineosporiaceae bacterium]